MNNKSIDRLSICIETTFHYSIPYQEKIRTIASLGFSAYEFWYLDMQREDSGWVVKNGAKDIDVLQRLNQELGLKLIIFAANTPNGNHGGHLLNREGTEMLMRNLDSLIAIAQKLNVNYIIIFPGFELQGIPKKKQFENFVSSLKRVDSIIDGSGVKVGVEPLSLPKYAGYILPTINEVSSVLREAGGKNVKILFDFFHVQSMTGNLIASLRENIDLIGHVHIAGIPGQHEPAEGEINYPLVLQNLSDMGYKEYFGLEYYPIKEIEVSLEETINYLSGVSSF